MPPALRPNSPSGNFRYTRTVRRNSKLKKMTKMDENLTEKNLLELFKEFNKNRIDYNIRKWETIKFFESIFTALIVASIGGIITAVKLDVINNVLVLTGLLLLPICSCIALYFGIRNLNRESRLLFIEEASMFKIVESRNYFVKKFHQNAW